MKTMGRGHSLGNGVWGKTESTVDDTDAEVGETLSVA